MTTFRIPVTNLDTEELVLMEVEAHSYDDAVQSALVNAFRKLRWQRSGVRPVRLVGDDDEEEEPHA